MLSRCYKDFYGRPAPSDKFGEKKAIHVTWHVDVRKKDLNVRVQMKLINGRSCIARLINLEAKGA